MAFRNSSLGERFRVDRGLYLRLCCFALCLLLFPHVASAHRPGESYVYLIVDEGPLTGELHIRFSDLAKAVPLDIDGDGVVTEAEVLESYAEITAYLMARVKLFDQSGPHNIVPGDMDFFGPDAERQMLLRFSVPTIDPPPDELGAQFRFLYDGLDPEHRPMLLMKSNTRTGLVANESMVSLVFEPGADQQVVNLQAPPLGRIISDTLLVGFERTVLNGFQVAVILMAFLGSLRWWAPPGAMAEKAVPALVANAGLVALALASGVCVGLIASEFLPLRLNDHHTKNVLAAALGLAALGTLLATSTIPRLIALFVAGAFCGATHWGFNFVFGLNVGFIEMVLPVFVVAVFLACCLLAALILPVGSVLYRGVGNADRVIQLVSAAVATIAVLFLFQRLVL